MSDEEGWRQRHNLMFYERVKSSIKTVAPGLLMAAVIVLPWFLFSAYRSFRDDIRDSALRLGVVDSSGRPHFSVSAGRLGKQDGADRTVSFWEDAKTLYLSDGTEFFPFKAIEDIDAVSAKAGSSASLVAGGENFLVNGSFESGPWRPKVFDCDEYDKNGAIGMALDVDEKTDGERSLRLEARRHSACTFIDLPLSEAGEHLFSFDYQSPNAQEARFFFSFNDSGRTAVSGGVEIDGTGWQTYAGKIDVPSGATFATLYLYAVAVDGETEVINRYDNVYFGKLAVLAAIRPAAKTSEVNSPSADAGKVFVLSKNGEGLWQIEAGEPSPLPWFYHFLVIAGDLAFAAYLGGLFVLCWSLAKRWKLFGKIPKPRWSDIARRLLLAAADIRRRPWFLIASVLIGLSAVFFANWAAGALWFLFLVFLLYEWDNRIIVALALVSLAACSFLALLKRGSWAETAAVYAFYFMAMTIILCFIESKRHPTRFYDQ